MVLRYKYAFAKADILRKAVKDAQEYFMPKPPETSYIEDGVTITKEYMQESIRLLDNLDLYFADDLPQDIKGEAEKLLASRGFCRWADPVKIIARKGIEPDQVIGIHDIRRW